MKVKIGDKIHDAVKEPIMVILTDKDKENIANMHDDKFKYVVYPDSMTLNQIINFSETKQDG